MKKFLSVQGIDVNTPEGVQQVVRTARERVKDPTAACEPWYMIVIAWLVETACDAVMFHYYGTCGVNALRSYLEVHSPPKWSESHPSPQMRLWVLEHREPNPKLSGFLDSSLHSLERLRVQAYQHFAPLVRDAVIGELSGEHLKEAVRQTVAADARKRRGRGEPPISSDWDAASAVSSPSSVESGLVASLWVEGDPVSPDGAPLQGDVVEEVASWERRVQHAVDFLQFQHRFLSQVSLEYRESDPDDFEVTNAFHVSLDGVRADERATGRPSRDVRLGRHFIVFRRNSAVSLNAVSGKGSRGIQEMVEVGWGEPFVLHPQEMVLAVTLESILMSDDCNAQVLSRSSLGRMGLLSATAVEVQSGFRGCLTLELVNLTSIPLEITPGQRVAQIVPAAICGQPHRYDGKYQNQDWLPRYSEGIKDKELKIIGNLRERE
ncbi:dCTP deaminase [Segeticoccus rhizosphaerae]|uniref:dCTP deaminase n=1 Tax=Segeticoccus rhizosphaerae TaxID=1104777 RepID=UPI0013969067|nr:dCTP deaminase [Segeticoccus rhizosphaerae]